MTSGWFGQDGTISMGGRQFSSSGARGRAGGEENRGEVTDEVLAADRLVLDAALCAVRRRPLLHQVIPRLGRHLVRADAECEEELALLEADAVADDAQHARRAQRVVAALRGQLALPRQRARLADDERVGDEIAEAAAARIGERRD